MKYYFQRGNPSRILKRRLFEGGEGPAYQITRFYYNTSNRVWLIYDETADADANGNPINCVGVRCREYRYDGGRQRYLVMERDPLTLQRLDGAEWHDYDGDAIDLDYRVDRQTGDITLQRRYLAGIAQQDAAASQDGYFHGDQIGSTRLMTGPGGAATLRALYTAFGLPLAWNGTDDTRYGYAGAWGYQHGRVPQTQPSDPPDTMYFLHVGERWYDPLTGRFLQRDPIGISGGLNAYLYCDAAPSSDIDPDGMGWGPWYHPSSAEFFLDLTGGRGHVPVLDPGPAQTAVQTTAEVASIASPCGAAARAITMGGKAVRAAQKATPFLRPVVRQFLKLRKYIRYDRGHHGKPPHWDGTWIR